MEGTVIHDRYKVVRELKPPRDGKIYWVVEDQQKGKDEEKDGCGNDFERQ